MTNLYTKYLLADRLVKITDRAGGYAYCIEIKPDAVNLFVEMPGGYSNQGNEDIAVALLDVCDEVGLPVDLIRENGLIFIRGAMPNGLRFEFFTGSGVCEIVQVGTRVEKQPDPEYIAAAPVIDVEVPVFERRCPDPLAGATA